MESVIANGEKSFLVPPSSVRKRRASTVLISKGPVDVRRVLSPVLGAETKEVEGGCCGGGCCFLNILEKDPAKLESSPVVIPSNDAFNSLHLKLGPLSLDTELTKLIDLPPETVSFKPLTSEYKPAESRVRNHPPKFVTPHHP